MRENATTYETKYENVEYSTQKKKFGIVLDSPELIHNKKNYKIFNCTKDIACICNETNKGFQVDNHFHDWIEFSYILEGEQQFMIKSKKFNICAGDFLMVNFGEMHGSINKTACKKIILQIKKSFMTQYLPELDVSILFCNSVTLKLKREFELYEEIIEIFQELVAVFLSKDEHKMLLSKSYLFHIFYKLTELSKERQTIVDGNEKTSMLNELDENSIILYINNNYHLGITLNELANTFNYSPSFVSRFFKEKIGLNFTEYINELRLNHAVYEITHTENRIADICYSCGFNNSKSFFNAFKKKFNMSPKQYRISHKERFK